MLQRYKVHLLAVQIDRRSVRLQVDFSKEDNSYEHIALLMNPVWHGIVKKEILSFRHGMFICSLAYYLWGWLY